MTQIVCSEESVRERGGQRRASERARGQGRSGGATIQVSPPSFDNHFMALFCARYSGCLVMKAVVVSAREGEGVSSALATRHNGGQGEEVRRTLGRVPESGDRIGVFVLLPNLWSASSKGECGEGGKRERRRERRREQLTSEITNIYFLPSLTIRSKGS